MVIGGDPLISVNLATGKLVSLDASTRASERGHLGPKLEYRENTAGDENVEREYTDSTLQKRAYRTQVTVLYQPIPTDTNQS